MSARDHERYQADVGAYLLGALTELEQQAFEQHLAGCDVCQQDLAHLRIASEALPRSVEQFKAPDSLRESLMSTVRAEAGEAPAAAQAPAPRRIRFALPRLRPELAWMAAAGLLAAVLVAAGFYQLGQRADDSDRTVAAEVDDTRVPDAGGRLVIPDEGGKAAVLEVNGMPRLQSGQVFHVWLKRGDQLVPSSMFNVATNGEGTAGIAEDLDDVDAILVTRENGPAITPSEPPILTVPL